MTMTTVARHTGSVPGPAGGALSSKGGVSLEQMKEMLLLQQRRLDEAAAGGTITPVSPYVRRSELKKLELVVRSDYLDLLCELHGRKLAEIQRETDCRLQVMKNLFQRRKIVDNHRDRGSGAQLRARAPNAI